MLGHDPPLRGRVRAGAAGRGPAGCSIADECHGLGGATLRRAMLPQYDERLGLTATLERSDDAVTELLLPYFGGICHRYGFEQAIADGVCAPPRVAFVGVELTVEERAEYTATEQSLVDARHHLRQVRDMPLEPFGDFLAAVAHLAERDAGADGRAAARVPRRVLQAARDRGADPAASTSCSGGLAPAIRDADGALVFTETVRAANHAINRLDPLVSIDLITGSTARRQRREILDDLRDRKLDAVAAPRVLDEGVDVPDANLGIVMSASRTRRQMIQRMGRILRRKRPGVAARFVIMFAKDTLEDPAQRIDRDGFLDEIERISEATGVFDGARFEALDALPRRARPGGGARAGATRAVRARRGARRRGGEPRVGGGRRAPRRTDGGRIGVRVPELRRPATRRARPMTPPSECSARASRSPHLGPRRTWRSSSPTSRRSPHPGWSARGCRPDRRRWRSRASATRGGSAARVAARRRRS